MSRLPCELAGRPITLKRIQVPDSIQKLPYTEGAEELIDAANEAIEKFMLRDEKVIENFVTSDFHLFDQAVGWILQNNLLTGNRFCEFGSGFGVCTMLAALHGMEAIGVEIESSLVEHSSELAESFDNDARFYCGSFVPPGLDRELLVDGDANNADTDDDGVYDSIGLDVEDFDLIFAFPWPAEYSYFETIFDEVAADGTLLLTYRGREGMHLLRKM